MKNFKILFAEIFLLTTLSLSIYAQVPLYDFMPANGVLGTTDFVTNTNYTAPTASTFAEPTGAAVDPTTGKLFIADRDNRRVLRWSSVSKLVDGSDAEAVFGQPDFFTRDRNTGGLSAATTNDPNGVCVDVNGSLWVADMTNNRVLRFDNASTITSSSSADGVLGQPDFVTNTAGITASTMTNPTSVFVDGNGTLWVADRDNNRVLRFDNAATKPNGASADGVLGQADFVTATTGLTASTMDTPWGVFVDIGGRLWVADRRNNRVLRFDNATSKPNGASADGVLGEPDFTTSVFNTTQDGLGEPRGVAVDGLGRLFVVDEGNTRVIVYNNAAGLANGANANNVLGQPDFTTASSSPISASSLNYPLSLFLDNTNNHIWIPDTYNHRVLRYDVAPLPVELTSFTAITQNQKIILNWTTETELNNNGFEIQRRAANSEFVAIGFVKGAGTTTAQNEYTFTDRNLSNGIYFYRLKQIDFGGSYEYSSEVEVDFEGLVNYSLIQNYPNPFNPSTKIGYTLKERTSVKVTIMNILGEEVAVLTNEIQEQGFHELEFNASNLPNGIYFYSLRTQQYSDTKKMILMK